MDGRYLLCESFAAGCLKGRIGGVGVADVEGNALDHLVDLGAHGRCAGNAGEHADVVGFLGQGLDGDVRLGELLELGALAGFLIDGDGAEGLGPLHDVLGGR